MRGLTPDHGAERDERLIAARQRQFARHDRYIECTRNAHDLDLLLAHPVAPQRIEGAAHQRLHDEIVESRGDEREPQIARQQFTLDYLRLIVRHKSFLSGDPRGV